MQQVTEYCDTKEELEFARMQLLKYGTDSFFKTRTKENKTQFCVTRKD